MKDSFLTLTQIKESRLNIEGSIFLGNGKEVASKKEAKEYISSIKDKYSDATHNASAFIADSHLGFDDDKEPSGTAGSSILNVLKKYSLNNSVIVVTRYFGGKKLGIRGLINAYEDTTIALIKKAEIVERHKGYIYEIETDYAVGAIICKKGFLKGMDVVEKIYLDKVLLKIFIKKRSGEEFKTKLSSLKHHIITKEEHIG